MLLLLGASGYVGHAFASELLRRRVAFIPLTRKAIDYTNFNLLFNYLRKMRPEFLINAAGFTGRPDEDACELQHEETLSGNTLLPQTIARACLMTNTPWGHISSGSIYAGVKIAEKGRMRINPDLRGPEPLELIESNPESLLGFTEGDEPNRSFRHPPCSFYSGTKALAEEMIRDKGQGYIWRPGAVFDQREQPRNFLLRLQGSERSCNSLASLSHLDDFVRSCLTLWERQAPFGAYNIVNPGVLTTAQIAQAIRRVLKPHKRFVVSSHKPGCSCSARTAMHSHSILDASKLARAGVTLRPIEEALEDALRNWQPVARSRELVFR